MISIQRGGVLQFADQSIESLKRGPAAAPQHGRLERLQLGVDLSRFFSAGAGEADRKRPPVLGAGLTLHQAARIQPVEHAGQRGALVREGAMQIGDRSVTGFVQMAEDVRLRLREIGRVSLDKQAYPMGGPVDAEDQLKAHQSPA